MPKVSFPYVDGDDAEDVMEGPWLSSLYVTETFVDSEADEVDPLMAHDEEVESLLKGRECSSNSIPIDFK